MRTLIVLPCYNEEKTIAEVLKGVLEWSGDCDVLVVDDGSTDQTPEILKAQRNLKVINHHINQGYGKALMDGFNYALSSGYQVCITMDCDAQHEPRLIPEFRRSLPGWDVVSGSRYLKSPQTPPPPDRYALNMEITKIINEITGYQLTDSFCGFKAYSVPALSKLHLDEPGYGLPLQFWIQAARAKLKVMEIPVPLIYMDYSRSFPGRLSNYQERKKYYLEIIERELKK